MKGFLLTAAWLALCIGVVRCLRHCSPHNLRLSEFDKAQWVLERDGTFSLFFEHCKLRQFTAATAKKCLRNNHIMFMGDSLSRYLYVSLASLISTGRWGSRLTHSTDPTGSPPSLMWEKDFDSWGRFYEVTNTMLNSNSEGTYELCDCHRDDTISWDGAPDCVTDAEHEFCSQQESTVENRHLRHYFRERGPEGATEAAQDMLRLSYIQFNGPMPMRGRQRLSVDVPEGEADYVRYLDAVGQELCPLDEHVGILDRAATAPHINITSGLVPMTSKCSRKLVKNRDRPQAQLNFPSFWDDEEGRLEQTVLRPLNVTHLQLNIGWHSPLLGRGDNVSQSESWMRTRLREAERFVDSMQLPVRVRNHALALPRFTWRETTAYGPFGQANDGVAHRVAVESAGRGVLRLGIFAVWKATGKLWDIHNWVLKHGGGPIDVRAYARRVADGRTAAGENSEPSLAEMDAAFDMLNVTLSSPLKDLLFSSNAPLLLALPRIYLDHAHPQPWTYQELNNAFLNSICHLGVTRYSDAKD